MSIAKETIKGDLQILKYTTVNDPDYDKDFDFSNSNITETSIGRMTLAAGASNVLLNLQGITNGKIVAIKAESEIQIRFNSDTGTLIPVKTMILESETGITSLYLTNPDASNAVSVKYLIAEDTTS